MSDLTVEQAWRLVEAVQKKHPGWRFCLLGGDESMGYQIGKDGNLKRHKGRLVVAEASRFAFGWKAEFFGDVDPRKDDGSRHAEGRGETMQEAIAHACEKALSFREAPDAHA